MKNIVFLVAAVTELGGIVFLLFAVDWEEFKAKRRDAAAATLRDNRKAELKVLLEEDYADRQHRMDKGLVPNVRVDMAPRFVLQAELAEIEAAEKQPVVRDDSKDRKYFRRRCVAAGLMVLGLLLGLLSASMGDEKDDQPQALHVKDFVVRVRD